MTFTEESEIVAGILEAMIESGNLAQNLFATADEYATAVCDAYKKVFKAVDDPSK